MKINNVTISTSNSKLGGFIPCINLPPVITCNPLAPCTRGGCYACTGNFSYANVKTSLKNNLNEFIKNPQNYFDTIINYLNNSLVIYKYFRWHSSGDIVNAEYFNGVIEVAKKCKNTTFLIFTKKFKIINDYLNAGGKIPKNLKVIFSAWDTSFKVVNPFSLPVSYVKFKDNNKYKYITPNDASGYPCKGKCENCLYCFKNNKNVVFNQH